MWPPMFCVFYRSSEPVSLLVLNSATPTIVGYIDLPLILLLCVLVPAFMDYEYWYASNKAT